jgi:hypothetical protein
VPLVRADGCTSRRRWSRASAAWARLVEGGARSRPFGSHFPLFYLESALLKLDEAALKAEDHRAVASGNATRSRRRLSPLPPLRGRGVGGGGSLAEDPSPKRGRGASARSIVAPEPSAYFGTGHLNFFFGSAATFAIAASSISTPRPGPAAGWRTVRVLFPVLRAPPAA